MSSSEIAVVSDYDRTLACESDGFRVRKEVVEVVNEFSKRAVFIVASGREERAIKALAPDLSPTAWVLENGAKIILGEEVHLLKTPDWDSRRETIVRILEREKIYYSMGDVIVYVNGVVSQKPMLEKLLRDLGDLEWNRQDLMILPRGVNKGSGVKKALEMLGFKGKVYAIGDSENDVKLFEIADVRVAVKNAIDQIKAMADIVLDEPNGRGVIKFLKSIAVFS